MMNALDGGWGGSRGVAGHAWRAYRGYPKPLEFAGAGVAGLRWISSVLPAIDSPDADQLKTDSLESTNHLLACGSRESHIRALPASTGIETSTEMGFPNFLATSIYSVTTSFICVNASFRVDPSPIHRGRMALLQYTLHLYSAP